MAERCAAQIDKNFLIPDGINKEGLSFFDALDLEVAGLEYIDGIYRRMTEEEAARVSANTLLISTESAGGRIRFATDSKKIAIYVEYKSVAKVPNYSMSATMGFDVYSNDRFVGVFVPPKDTSESYESVIDTPFSDGECHDYTIHFPISSEVKRVLVGIDDTAVMQKAREYSIKTPVVFYGSSITQGACASRAGSTYENMLSRKLDFDYINLGFWGNALGEEAMARYIAGLSMSAFVYDYDYNAPNARHLQKTHEPMFKIIREAHPTLPIIIMSATIPYPKQEDIERADVIKATYENAVARGDKNVYFLNGSGVISKVRDFALADNVHPADIGFYAMYEALSPILEKVLK